MTHWILIICFRQTQRVLCQVSRLSLLDDYDLVGSSSGSGRVGGSYLWHSSLVCWATRCSVSTATVFATVSGRFRRDGHVV